jgi:lipid-binding SYLF domain-containing protein
MRPTRRHALGTIGLAAAALALGPAGAARAADAAVIDARVDLALGKLYATVPGSRELAARSEAVLIMPKVVKGGFILGGAYGEGKLLLRAGEGFEPGGYYSVGAASIGLQAGVQETAHALFFLTEGALAGFRSADGWTLGADAEFTVPDKGMNVGVSSTEYRKPIVAVVFAEDGLLLGASLAGAKYSPIAR